MRSILEAQVQTSRLKLSHRDAKAYKKLDSYDWILFSSKNAAQYFAEDLKRQKISLPEDIRIAAVGEVTAKRLKRNGIRVDMIPKEATLKALMRSLGKIRGLRILFPRSAIAPKGILKTVREKGAIVRAIPLYTTTPMPLTKKQKTALIAGKYDAIHFKSPSGVRGLLNQLAGRERQRALSLKALCIGPTTAEAARKSGFRRVEDLGI